MGGETDANQNYSSSSSKTLSEKISDQMEQTASLLSSLQQSKEKYWSNKSKKNQNLALSPRKSEISAADYSNSCHVGETFHIQILFSPNHPHTKPRLGFNKKQSDMYDASDFCCF